MKKLWIAMVVMAIQGSLLAQSDAPKTNSTAPPSESATSQNTPTGNAPDSKPKRVRINQGVSQSMLIHKIDPVYPEAAKQSGVQGTVVLQATIDTNGAVKDLKAISSPAEDLTQAAINAVQQWRYKPLTLHGEPVEVDTTINVNFKLRK